MQHNPEKDIVLYLRFKCVKAISEKLRYVLDTAVSDCYVIGSNLNCDIYLPIFDWMRCEHQSKCQYLTATKTTHKLSSSQYTSKIDLFTDISHHRPQRHHRQRQYFLTSFMSLVTHHTQREYRLFLSTSRMSTSKDCLDRFTFTVASNTASPGFVFRTILT